jgi:hypothetical protein
MCGHSSRRNTDLAYTSIRQHTSVYVSMRQHTSACVSIRQHASACVSIRQHTSAYVSIRQHAGALVPEKDGPHELDLDNLPARERGAVVIVLCSHIQHPLRVVSVRQKAQLRPQLSEHSVKRRVFELVLLVGRWRGGCGACCSCRWS